MNELKLKEFNEMGIVYLYRPEGRGQYGEISYFFADKKAKITKKAEEASIWHANKALSKVEECVTRNNLPIELTQAWY